MIGRLFGMGGDDDAALEREVAREERASRWRRLRERFSGRVLAWIVGGLAVALVLYYVVGAFVVSAIDDDPDYLPTEATPGSRAVGVAVALIERETDRHSWTANDPFFLPGSLLDNMPNYQQGIVYALSRFAAEMGDQIGRARGSSQVDPDLEKAAGLLKYPGDVWIFDPSTSWAPTATSESQYRAARRALLGYNERLAAGQAVFERRADNLQGTLERIAADLGSASAAIDQHLRSDPILDTSVDDVFYANKGRLYAYFLLLKALGEDFGPLVAQRDLQAVWAQMIESFREAALLDPPIVLGGRPDSTLVPSHLAAQGFYLLRARTQLKEVSNVLQK